MTEMNILRREYEKPREIRNFYKIDKIVKRLKFFT